jgi:SAM-dependent methyltransferase
MIDDLPSAFVADWILRLSADGPPVRRALDVAMGRGRHALALARAGFRTFGVDRNLDAIRDAMRSASAAGVPLLCWCADLTRPALPAGRFDIVVVTRYLQRDLFPALREAVVPGGVVLYETFTAVPRTHNRGPTSPDHLLGPGELMRLFDGFEVLAYVEAPQPDAITSMAARRRP